MVRQTMDRSDYGGAAESSVRAARPLTVTDSLKTVSLEASDEPAARIEREADQRAAGDDLLGGSDGRSRRMR